MEVALGIIITLLVALLGLLGNHISKCSAFHERVASLESDMKSVKSEIGDHQSGLRGAVHKLNNMLSGPYVKMQMDLERAERERK